MAEVRCYMAEGDFDVYLMEKGVMPLLLQGLDALSKHVDKVATGTTMGSSKQKFNPLIWLAQYLLRNHPGHIHDHRTGTYEKIRELAEVERGRRNLLRKQEEFENAWFLLAEDHEHMPLAQTPRVIEKLDATWKLEGEFARCAKLPDIQAADPEKVKFSEFWQSFEALVKESDLLRMSVFQDADRRQLRAENEAQLAKYEQQQRQASVEEELRQRQLLQDRFETICADVYINSALLTIMSKGSALAAPMDLKGEHVVLVLQLLRAWGYPVLNDDGDLVDQDHWDARASEVCRRWRQNHGPPSKTPEVLDSEGLKALVDKEAFQAHRTGRQDSSQQMADVPPPPPPPPPPADS
ncbi:unnamed protein product [Symbiodinium natans]|uniref:Uncharacterized protein n=1 Tax=Symbiodinium natans TaxID=878477 RepID=A0A812J5N8_9DINO|nr:unnamed protein product [Symbiodinium natans]